MNNLAGRQSNEFNGTSVRQNSSNTRSDSDQPKSDLHGPRNGETLDERTSSHITRQTSQVQLTCYEKYLSWRFLICLLLQAWFVVMMFHLFCLPMAIQCMVKPPSQSSSPASSFLNISSGVSNITDEDDVGNFQYPETSIGNASHGNSTFDEDNRYEFSWDSNMQGVILTSSTFPSFISPIIGNLVSMRLGGKLTFTLCNVIATLMTALTPTAARISPYCLVAVRIIIGLFQSGCTPISADFIAWWAPQNEKLTMSSVTFTGANIGNILVSILAGYLCLVPWDNGWPFVFYVIGALSLLWVLAWHFLSSNKPEEHPYISEKEKQYIISNRAGMGSKSGEQKVKPPFKKILTSVPVIAFLICGGCHVWTATLFFNYLPTFFRKGLHFSIQETGLLVSFTSVFRTVGSFMWIFIGNILVPRTGIARSRKICIVVGMMLSAICVFIVGFIDNSLQWVITSVLIVAMMSQSVGTSAITALPLDLAPRNAGLLTGIFLSFGCCISISAPLLAARITTEGTQEQWRIVWIITACVFAFGGLIFLFFGQATLQAWAKPKEVNPPHLQPVVELQSSTDVRPSSSSSLTSSSPKTSDNSQDQKATDSTNTGSKVHEIVSANNCIQREISEIISDPRDKLVDSVKMQSNNNTKERNIANSAKDRKQQNLQRSLSESETEMLRLNETLQFQRGRLFKGQKSLFETYGVVNEAFQNNGSGNCNIETYRL